MNGENGKRREFEGFSLDAERKILWRAGEIVPLPPKAVELLIVLVKNRGEVVSKNELLETVWGETFVEESVLSNNVYLLRKTLNELAGVKDLIQTVPRRGYRFGSKIDEDDSDFILEHHVFEQTLIEEIPDRSVTEMSNGNAPVISENKNQLQSNNAGQIVRPIPAQPTIKTANRRAPIYSLAAALLVLLTAGFAVWRWNQKSARANLTDVKSIAVLPFKSFDETGGDENLSLRMTDSLITKLGNLESVSVRPTGSIQSFKNANASEAGRKLGVDAILDGRVQREGERVRVTVQLVAVRSGEQIWSEQFDGRADRLLDLQDVISTKLLAKINPPLTADQTAAFARRATEDAEAFENYLKGNYFRQRRTEESLRTAISFYEKAFAADSNFAEACAGLADSYYLLVDFGYDTSPSNVTRAKENLLRALALKPNLAEAHVTLGLIETTYEWDWRRAEKSLSKAIELSPNSSNAHHRYAMLLLKLRRFAEAETAIRRAKELDPLSLGVNMNVGVVFYYSKRFDEAVEQFNKTIELDGNFAAPRWYLARCRWAKGEKSESLAEYARALRANGDAEFADFVEKAMLDAAPEKIIETWAEKWRAQLGSNGVNEHDLAVLTAHQSKAAETLQWLERSIESRHPWSISINAEPEFDFVRDEPRFQEILRKMNL